MAQAINSPSSPQLVNRLVILALLLAFFLGMGTMYAWKKYFHLFPFKSKGTACTLDAKICSDGTTVGRVPPDCKFAPCPITEPSKQPEIPADWKTYTNEEYGFEFRYPNDKYIIDKDDELKYSQENNMQVKENFEEYLSYLPPRFLFALKLIKKEYPQGLPANFNFPVMRIWIFDNKENKSIDRWYEDYWYYPFMWGKAVESEVERNSPKKLMILDSLQAHYTIQDSMGQVQYIYTSLNKKMFLFNVRGEPEEDNIGNQILSTFKFLNGGISEPINSGIVRTCKWAMGVENEEICGKCYCLETPERGCEIIDFTDIGDLSYAVDKRVNYKGTRSAISPIICPHSIRLSSIEIVP